MAVNVIQTQATILDVQNARGRVTIEAEIPDLGQYPTRFIRWEGAGNAPAVGAQVLATMEPTSRQSRFVKDGTFADEVIDGEEKPWQVNWQMTASTPLAGDNRAGRGSTAGAAQTPRSGPSKGSNGAAWMDAALRYRVDTMMVNDREAVRQAVAFGAAEGGNIISDVTTLLAMADDISGWWNARFLSRIGADSPLVAHAETLGAVVTDVAPAPEAPEIKNEAELREWVEGQGWSREAVVEAIRSAGYDSASEYLAAGGHTASGLASILTERLA